MKKYSIRNGNKVKRNSTTTHCRINLEKQIKTLSITQKSKIVDSLYLSTDGAEKLNLNQITG
ncbi:hypothetical protein VB776_08005 [Arcicella sp. DC2W]|uniref:Uncharacterized protein n=1 Tax=Arcicella gelida TaxID=2984195 RepID=A0ABU5S303_9BACT|nr:hypothetical protein [Arcicella sp. DC2W]MEA5402854.1 hypothetical protein [Arcicella sp. DC2W]